VGSAGPHFDTSLQSVGNTATIAANRLSFFFLQLSVPLSWAGAASDFFVYFPEKMSKWKIFMMTLTGLTFSFIFVNLLGVGLASGVTNNPSSSDAYNISSGALILAGYGGLGGFGKFCAVIVALGLGSNQIPSTYAAALDFQVLGRRWKAVPRYIWATVAAIIYFICAVAGRDHLFLIFQNFLALMGYWLAIFITIVLEEHTIFRRHVGFDWTAWEDRKRLPLGIAALTAFLIGWVGPIVGMYQVWWTGPIARMLGDNGGDVGVWLGIAFSGVTYPPLRYLELKKIGR
jgi:purine-cytosine permease-like protein